MHKTELYHHGVKGQKWGVRRYQKADGTLTRAGKKRYGKELSKKQSDMYKSEVSALSKRYGLADKEAELEAFSRKHHDEFDMDDGGGATTARAQANANRYMKMLEEHEALIDRIDFEASKNTAEKFLKRYGQEGVDALKTYERNQVIKAMGATLAVPVAIIAATIALDQR